jgi:glycosyltransferase involved in cell wall biosynthesis
LRQMPSRIKRQNKWRLTPHCRLNTSNLNISTKPLVSIIMPVCNAEKFVGQALKSIAAQTFREYELLLIDGMSTDSTALIIRNMMAADSRISLYIEKDQGIYDAMNKGVLLAKGDWVYFMGADDEFYNENVLNNIVSHLTSKNDIVYGDSIWMPENKKEQGQWTADLFIKANINHQRIFYRKTLFEKFGAFNTKYKVAADHELNIRFFCNCQIKKQYISEIVANYHSCGFSARKTDVAFYEDWDRIVLKNFRTYLPKKLIYGSQGTYIRYLIDKRENHQALKLLLKHFIRTRSLGFAKLMLQYYLKSLQYSKLNTN